MAEAFNLSGILDLDSSDFVSGADDAASASDDVARATDGTADSLFDLEPAGFAAGAGLASVGTGAQALIDSSRENRETLALTAETMGVTDDTARDLATSMTDATLPIEDATGAMDAFASIGVDTQDEMRELTEASDNLADATGTTATSVAENLAPVARGLDGDLDALVDSQDAFTLAARNTGTSVEELSGTIGRLDFDEIEEMGLGMEETTGLVAKFSEETGYTGRQLRSNFNQAVEEADGDLEELQEELGLGEDALDEWSDELEENEGITDRHADAVGNQASTMDHLRARLADTKLQFSGMLGPVSAVAPAMQTAGIAAMTYSTINTSAVIPSITAKMAALAPLMPMILGITAAVAALYLAWDSNFLGIRDVTVQVASMLRATLGSFVEWLEGLWRGLTDRLDGDWSSTWSSVRETLGIATELIRETIGVFIEWFAALWSSNNSELAAEWDRTWSSVRETLTAVIDFARPYVEAFLEALTAAFRAFWNITEPMWSAGWEHIQAVASTVTEVVRILVEGFIDTLTSVISAGLAIVRGDWDEAWSIMTDLTSRNTERIIDVVMAFADLFRESFERAVDAAIEVFTNLWDTLVGNSIVPDMLDDIIGAVTDFDLAGAFSEKVGEAIDVFSGAVGDFVDAGSNLASSVADGIRDGISSIRSAASDAASAARNRLPSSPAKEGPLSDLDEIGPGLTREVADGMTSTTGDVGRASDEVAEAADVDPSTLLGGSSAGSRGETAHAPAQELEASLVSALERADRTDELLEAFARLLGAVRALETGEVKAKDVLRALDIATDRRAGRDPRGDV